MSPQPELRIGDAEREAASSALAEHFAAGRLTRDEYDERSSQVWAAKTRSDLSPLFVDLPAPGGPKPSFGQSVAGRPAHGAAGFTRPTPARRHPPGGDRRFRFPWLPVILLVVGLSFLLPGPWWLLLVGAFVFSRVRHGCGH